MSWEFVLGSHLTCLGWRASVNQAGICKHARESAVPAWTVLGSSLTGVKALIPMFKITNTFRYTYLVAFQSAKPFTCTISVHLDWDLPVLHWLILSFYFWIPSAKRQKFSLALAGNIFTDNTGPDKISFQLCYITSRSLYWTGLFIQLLKGMCHVTLERMSCSSCPVSFAAPHAVRHCIEPAGTRELQPASPFTCLILNSPERTALSRQDDHLHSYWNIFTVGIYFLN